MNEVTFRVDAARVLGEAPCKLDDRVEVEDPPDVPAQELPEDPPSHLPVRRGRRNLRPRPV